MNDDERQIRALVQTWMAATKAGETEKVLSLMTGDVVFLVPGRPPMKKADFAAAAGEQAKPGGPGFDGESEIQDIKIAGDWAFMWTKLKVTVRPPGGAQPIVRAGHTLTVLNQRDGQWLIARDANLLVTVKPNDA